MRPRVEWMTQGDERILEFLSEKDIVASPSVIAANIDYTAHYVSQRCRKLVDHGLLQRADASNYQITESGEDFLAGDISREDIK